MLPPFPGMDPFVEKNPIFHELHTQMLASAQGLLQPQVRPGYVVRLERHLSEGSVWGLDVSTLDRKEPDVAIIEGRARNKVNPSNQAVTQPTAVALQELEPDELELRRQRRIVIYVDDIPRKAVTSIELLSPSNKERGSVGQARYLEKRSSALHGGLHWVEIDLLREGERPRVPLKLASSDYLAYIAIATETGWEHDAYTWSVRDPLPRLKVPLLGDNYAVLDLGACFAEAYDRIAADDEAAYAKDPPSPPFSADDALWIDQRLREAGLR